MKMKDLSILDIMREYPSKQWGDIPVFLVMMNAARFSEADGRLYLKIEGTQLAKITNCSRDGMYKRLTRLEANGFIRCIMRGSYEILIF